MTNTTQLEVEQVELLGETVKHQGFLSVSLLRLRHPLFAGGMSGIIEREVMKRSRAAVLLAYDPLLASVVVIEQFRVGPYVAGDYPWQLELVAGIEEQGESLEALVEREAMEEAGLSVIGDLIKICEYYVSPGGNSERVSLFCGRVDASSAGGLFGLAHEGEDIRVHVMPLSEAFEAVQSGRIRNAASIIALQWLQINQSWVFR